MIDWFRTVGCDRLEGCIQDRPVRIEDLHNVHLTTGQLEQVGPGRQYLSRDLDWLAETDGGGLVGLVSMGPEFEEEGKSNDQTYSNVTFVDFHIDSSP